MKCGRPKRDPVSLTFSEICRLCVSHRIHAKSSSSLLYEPRQANLSSSIPSWQILIAHAQPFRGARDLAFCLKVPLDSLLVWASSEGSGETARMRRLAWTFAARIGDSTKFAWRSPYIILLLAQSWQFNVSRLVTKPTKWHVRYAKTQISQGIRPVWSVSAIRMKKAWVLSDPLNASEALIRLGGCPGWSESSLGAQSLCCFFHEAAHVSGPGNPCSVPSLLSGFGSDPVNWAPVTRIKLDKIIDF